MVNPQRWVFYALGGGLGHLTRAVALGRAVTRWGNSEGQPLTIDLLTNSPFASAVNVSAELGSEHRVIALSPQWNRDETATYTVDFLSKTPCDYLVVDTFPRGLCGELSEVLPKLACRKVLVHRDLNPKYIQQFDLLNCTDQFDQLVLPGESAPFETCAHAFRTKPWLIRDHEELFPPNLARDRLAVDSDSVPIVAVMGSGKVHEVDQMKELAWDLARSLGKSVAVRFITPHQQVVPEDEFCSPHFATIPLWPFFPLIRATSVIVGGGGYNTVQEARATATPFVGCPQPRLYDRQWRRLKPYETALTPHEVLKRVADALEQKPPGQTHHPYFENGVRQAVWHIANAG
ncbi:MAG: hypothetical protein KDA84_30020 [Planctomycetaceae bacterium]|nr:hypothetical protein [Planctomycetaceae bacterium]